MHTFSTNYTTPNENRKRNKKKKNRCKKDAKKRCGLHNFRAPKISLLLLHSFFFYFRFSLFFSVYFCSIFYIRFYTGQSRGYRVRFIVFSPACDGRLSKSNLGLSVFVYIYIYISARMYACILYAWIIKKLELFESVCTCSSVSTRVENTRISCVCV